MLANTRDCYVDFMSPDAYAAASPMVLLGDVLSDLPEVSNFCLTDQTDYETEPQTPHQASTPTFRPRARVRVRLDPAPGKHACGV